MACAQTVQMITFQMDSITTLDYFFSQNQETIKRLYELFDVTAHKSTIKIEVSNFTSASDHVSLSIDKIWISKFIRDLDEHTFTKELLIVMNDTHWNRINLTVDTNINSLPEKTFFDWYLVLIDGKSICTITSESPLEDRIPEYCEKFIKSIRSERSSTTRLKTTTKKRSTTKWEQNPFFSFNPMQTIQTPRLSSIATTTEDKQWSTGFLIFIIFLIISIIILIGAAIAIGIYFFPKRTRRQDLPQPSAPSDTYKAPIY